MHLDDGMDLVSLMFWLIVGLMSTVFCFGVVAKNMKPYTLPDKSAITAISDNTPDPYQWYVRDYLLMLMVADEFCPEPKAIDIQFGKVTHVNGPRNSSTNASTTPINLPNISPILTHPIHR